MIKTFHYYKFWVSFLNMLVGQSKKSLIFHTHLNQNSRYSTEIRGGTNSSMFTNCLVLGNFREVQNSVLGQNHMFRYVQSSFETSFSQPSQGRPDRADRGEAHLNDVRFNSN